MAEAEINWYEEDVVLAVERASDEFLTQLAFQGEALAKVNIQANGQIDTGFMLNSTYGMGPNGSHRGEAQGAAYAAAAFAGEAKGMAPAPTLEDGQAGLHAAAEYAIYQEMRQSFLYKAVEALQEQAGGEIQAAGRKVGL